MPDHHRPLRVGICGFGLFAERAIAPALRACPETELVALQKRSMDEARAKAAQHAVPLAFSSVEDLVAHPDVDAVFLVSANNQHCRETVAAARAGKHVLVEKPMAMSAAEADEMITACRAAGVRLMVGHMIRFSPLVLRMREIVHSGVLGRIFSARADFVYDARLSHRSWLTDRAVAGGGPVFDVGVHCLDTLRWVLDDEPDVVRSVLEPEPTAERTEVTATLALHFTRGTTGSITCSYEAPVRKKSIEIVGTEGALRADEFTVGDITAVLQVDPGKDSRPAPVRLEEFRVPNLYVEELSHFVRCIRDGIACVTPGENGLANQRILDQALRAGVRR